MIDLPISLGEILSLAKKLLPSAKVSDLKPCNTRFMPRKAKPNAWFRRQLCAVHRLPNGKFALDPIDPDTAPLETMNKDKIS